MPGSRPELDSQTSPKSCSSNTSAGTVPLFQRGLGGGGCCDSFGGGGCGGGGQGGAGHGGGGAAAAAAAAVAAVPWRAHLQVGQVGGGDPGAAQAHAHLAGVVRDARGGRARLRHGGVLPVREVGAAQLPRRDLCADPVIGGRRPAPRAGRRRPVRRVDPEEGHRGRLARRRAPDRHDGRARAPPRAAEAPATPPPPPAAAAARRRAPPAAATPEAAADGAGIYGRGSDLCFGGRHVQATREARWPTASGLHAAQVAILQDRISRSEDPPVL